MNIKFVENIFFSVTCIAVFTCIIRSDYNFAMGLLCYYMIKNARDKIDRVSTTVSTGSKFKFQFRGPNLLIADCIERDDNYPGCPVDPNDAQCVVRQTCQERKPVEGIQQRPRPCDLPFPR